MDDILLIKLKISTDDIRLRAMFTTMRVIRFLMMAPLERPKGTVAKSFPRNWVYEILNSCKLIFGSRRFLGSRLYC